VFDYVIATHADYDHIGNFDDIFKDFEVKYVYRPYVKYSGSAFTFDDAFNKGSNKYKQGSKAYGTFLNSLKNETYVENGETKTCGYEFFDYKSDFSGKIKCGEEIYEYYFDFLTPRTDDLNSLVYKNANDYSPMIKFTYEGVDIMFTGDSEGSDEGDGEDDFVAYYKNLEDVDLDVEILKVAHHGSRSSTTKEFLDLVKPEFSIIQCGIANSYKHPHQVTLDKLLQINSALYRNDIHGDILLSITKEGTFKFTTQKASSAGLFVGGDA
jgi:competence protein ComEC